MQHRWQLATQGNGAWRVLASGTCIDLMLAHHLPRRCSISHVPYRSVPPWLGLSLQQLLPLLLDTHPDIQAASAVTLAQLSSQLLLTPPDAVTAAADVAGQRVTTVPATILFDWLADTLGSAAGRPTDAALLNAMTQAVALAPPSAPLLDSALRKVLGACVELLDAASTRPTVLPHILACLEACIAAETRAQQQQQQQLLGWSLDDAVEDADRCVFCTWLSTATT